MTKNETMGKNNRTGPKTKVRFAGIMKEENSGNNDSAGTERKARLVGMTKEEYLNNADKTEPSKKTPSFFRLTEKPLKHKATS